MTTRRLAALSNLAERPGTHAEGNVAREKLKRAERSTVTWPITKSRGITSTCDCGGPILYGLGCVRSDLHYALNGEMRRRFPRGTRVYYNKWAYSRNCPAFVTGYSEKWNWIRLKFDHLKTSRAVPIYVAGRWHLSTTPVTDAATLRDLRGGMEDLDG